MKMKKIVSSIVTLMLLFLFPLSALSQVGYMYINQKSGNVIKIARNEVASITFGSEAAQDFNLNFDVLTRTGYAHTVVDYTGNDFNNFQNMIEDVGYCYCLTSESEFPTIQHQKISTKSALESVVKVGENPYMRFEGNINGETGKTYSVRAYIVINGTVYYSYTLHYFAEDIVETDQIIINASQVSNDIVSISVNSIINGNVFPNAGFVEYGTSSGSYTTLYNCTAEAMGNDGQFSVQFVVVPGIQSFFRVYYTFPDGSPNLYSDEVSITTN